MDDWLGSKGWLTTPERQPPNPTARVEEGTGAHGERSSALRVGQWSLIRLLLELGFHVSRRLVPKVGEECRWQSDIPQ